MKRAVNIVSALLIAFLLGTGLGYSIVNPTHYEKRIGILENEIVALDSQINMLQSEKASLGTQISQLKQQLETEVLGVYFSPKGGCENQIIYWVNRANVSIHILIYSFTLDSIGDALIGVQEKGVEVKIVFEVGQINQYSEYQRLKVAGIAVRNDTNPEHMHSKVMIVDGAIVLTGSFNWSKQAQDENNENLIVIKSNHTARIYEDEFTKIWNKGV